MLKSSNLATTSRPHIFFRNTQSSSYWKSEPMVIMMLFPRVMFASHDGHEGPLRFSGDFAQKKLAFSWKPMKITQNPKIVCWLMFSMFSGYLSFWNLACKMLAKLLHLTQDNSLKSSLYVMDWERSHPRRETNRQVAGSKALLFL